ncbi:hypothetical protein V6N12_045830 [Hibiscus sabdariffa]|uniref:RNase H type-1 domain-containing protein n=1 Tax=Hibiscus sabdariffa TaxID=183260 RepID=A0ABR2G412_9ROSI
MNIYGQNQSSGMEIQMGLDVEEAGLVEDSCEPEIKRLWENFEGTIPDRLREVCTGLDSWFHKLRSSRKVTISALRKRLEFLTEQTPKDDVLGDCHFIITKLQSPQQDLSVIIALIWAILEMAKSLNACQFRYIPRTGNQVAHTLARDSSSGEADRYSVEELPPSDAFLVESDKRGLDPP